MVDEAVDRNISEQVRDIIVNVIEPIRRKSKRPDTIFVTEYITRNLTNFEAELRNCISELVDSRILINRKTEQDLDSLFINGLVLAIHPVTEQDFTRHHSCRYRNPKLYICRCIYEK